MEAKNTQLHAFNEILDIGAKEHIEEEWSRLRALVERLHRLGVLKWELEQLRKTQEKRYEQA
jgi:hypothetical protein